MFFCCSPREQEEFQEPWHAQEAQLAVESVHEAPVPVGALWQALKRNGGKDKPSSVGPNFSSGSARQALFDVEWSPDVKPKQHCFADTMSTKSTTSGSGPESWQQEAPFSLVQFDMLVDHPADLGVHLGLVVVPKPAGLCVTNMAQDGNYIACKWNQKYPGYRIMPGDVITQVNGIVGADSMLQEVKRCKACDSSLSLRIGRVSEFVVHLVKRGPLGLMVEGDELAIVMSVQPGMVDSYNRQHAGYKLVVPGDILHAVNRKTGSCKALLQFIEEEPGELTLRFKRSPASSVLTGSSDNCSSRSSLQSPGTPMTDLM